ncbi:MAG: glycosyltransferase family 4 protein [Methylobacter sp.]|nr:glycosyltransferase family 4 protein [Methylobacter sp.]
MIDNPTFAFVTIGSGSYLGSTVRDLTLANDLHRRGYKVVVYWMLECNPDLVDDGIKQRILCHGTRYQFQRPSEFLDRVIGWLLFLPPLKFRVKVTQGLLTGYVDRLLKNLIRSLNETPEGDAQLVKRLLKYMAQDQVDYLMMSFASISPLALAAKKNGSHPFDYLVTFQGDEQFANYARRAGLSDQYQQRLDEVIRCSPWPAIAVSQDYLNRLVDEMGVDEARLRVLYNGVELPKRDGKPPFSILKTVFPELKENIPIVSYVGRQDTEKGIDLLLYATKLLEAHKIPMQLVICGSTAKGKSYERMITDLADHLGLNIHHVGSVAPEIRDALYAHSHCMVYPSVNREAFGLVSAEAMSQGTPVLVPDYGGITEVIRCGEKVAGLTFKTWDSGNLARQLERLLTDEKLYKELAENTRAIASRFSAEQMTDAVLEHIHIGAGSRERGAAMPIH